MARAARISPAATTRADSANSTRRRPARSTRARLANAPCRAEGACMPSEEWRRSAISGARAPRRDSSQAPGIAAKTTGTSNNVENGRQQQAADDRAPQRSILLRPFSQTERHRQHAEIMASAVISTGRIRVAPASSAADSAGSPSRIRCRANETTRMLLAVATPMVMMAPVSAGTLSVVPVRNSIQAIPANAAGNALTMISGSTQDWKLTTISRYTSTIAIASPPPVR